MTNEDGVTHVFGWKKKIINYFGSQSVVASVDYKIEENNAWDFDWKENHIIEGL